MNPHAYAVLDDDAEYAEAPNADVAHAQEPERALLVAVLERAILDVSGRGQEGGHYRKAVRTNLHEAFIWLTVVDRRPWSFWWVCAQLGVEVESARRRMFELALSDVIVDGMRGDWRNA
jgi:hypothetical protein